MSSISVNQEIKEVALKDISCFKDNPRGISGEALTGLRKSLERFGYVDLLVVNKRNMTLVSGHQRYKVLCENGVSSVPAILVDLDDLQHKALCLSLNNQQIAGYFTEAVIPLLEELRNQLPQDYLDLRLQELREECNDFEMENNGSGKTLPDDIPEPPKETITKPGDLWLLGDHRLLCGSSTNPEDVERLMDGNKAQLLATDPPYCIDYTGADRPTGGKDWSDTYKEIDIPDAYVFWSDFLKIGLSVVDINSAIYFWYASSKYSIAEKVFNQMDILLHQNLIWVKPCMNLTFSIYPWRHEPCLFGWRKGHRPFFRVKHKSVGTVWSFGFLRNGDPTDPSYYSDVWELDYEGKSRAVPGMHPTVKPTECFAIPMRVHTKPGDI
jgi:DNA modification methylase